MARKNAGNPTGAQVSYKMTPEYILKLEQAFSIDATIWEACSYADISTNTYYNWIKEKPELLERFNRLREKPVLSARQTVVKSIKENPEMALKYLERKRKKEFSLRTEIWQEEGEVFKMDVTVNYEAMTPKEIQEAIKKEMWDI